MGTFLDFGVTVLKPGFWWVIKFKLTSIIAANVYYDCSIGGGGRFGCYVMYWTPRGRGYPPPTVGNFLEILVLNSGFCAL